MRGVPVFLCLHGGAQVSSQRPKSYISLTGEFKLAIGEDARVSG